MHRHGKPSTVDEIRLMIKLLEQLGVEHSHEKVKGAVIVRDHGENRRFLLSQTPQLQFIVLGNAGQTVQIELLQAGDQRDLDGLQRLAAAGVIVPVVFQGDVLRIAHLQPLEENVQSGLVGVVILPDISGPDHLHDHGKILLLRRGLVVQIEDQRQKQHGGRLIPEGVLRLAALRCGVFEQVRHQTLNVVVIPQIHEGVVAVAPVHVDEIQHPDRIPLCLQQLAGAHEQLSLLSSGFEIFFEKCLSA